MSTAVQLCSRALVMVGANPITALDGTDTSTEATVAAQIYESAIKDLLSRYRWRFAAKQEIITATTGNALARWDATFDLPADCLVIHSLTDEGTNIDFDRYGDQIGAAAASNAVLVMDYTYRAAESVFPPYFDALVELHLAAIFAYSIANQLDLSDYLEKKAARAFSFAKTQDTQGRTTKKLDTSRFLQARGFSTGDDAYSSGGGSGGTGLALLLDQIKDGSMPGSVSPIPVTNGGTGSATASGARTNLGLGTIATQNASAVSITGGSIAGITDLAVADGGTGASNASGARTNLGLVIGTDVVAQSHVGSGNNAHASLIGATSGTAGTAGFVPAPAAGDQGKFLRGDATWQTIAGSGTVTSITAGTGLTGGTITTSGTIAIDTATVATLTDTQTLTNKTFGSVITMNGAANIGVNVTGNSTGTFGRGFRLASEIQSSAGTNYFGYYSNPSTAASVTLDSLQHFTVVQGTFGAGTAITNQYGLRVGSGLTGATNNYGVASEIASGSNRWNFYASGTANNAFAGNTRFGGTTAPTVAVDVTGDITATGLVTGGDGALYPLKRGTAVASTSGTSIDFTGIPSWAKRIKLIFRGVSLSGTDNILVRLGTSGGFVSTGYVSSSGSYNNSNATSVSSSTTGYLIRIQNAASTMSGEMAIENISSNIWTSAHNVKLDTTLVCQGGGDLDLAGTLTQVRILTAGTNTFDAGSINITWEG